jgi:hypothetical protein
VLPGQNPHKNSHLWGERAIIPEELVLEGEKVCALRVGKASKNGKLDANQQLIEGKPTEAFD